MSKAEREENEANTPPAPEAQRHTIQINYTSGHSMVVKADSFTVKKTYGGVTMSYSGMVPRPLYFNIDEVESVWQL